MYVINGLIRRIENNGNKLVCVMWNPRISSFVSTSGISYSPRQDIHLALPVCAESIYQLACSPNPPRYHHNIIFNPNKFCIKLELFLDARSNMVPTRRGGDADSYHSMFWTTSQFLFGLISSRPTFGAITPSRPLRRAISSRDATLHNTQVAEAGRRLTGHQPRLLGRRRRAS